jgi:hypothetical protein
MPRPRVDACFYSEFGGKSGGQHGAGEERGHRALCLTLKIGSVPLQEPQSVVSWAGRPGEAHDGDLGLTEGRLWGWGVTSKGGLRVRRGLGGCPSLTLCQALADF